MSICFLYKQDSGRLSTIFPLRNLDPSESIALARSSVPNGKPFKVIDSAILPSDMTYRDAWTIDESYLTDGIGERQESNNE